MKFIRFAKNAAKKVVKAATVIVQVATCIYDIYKTYKYHKESWSYA